MEERLIGFLFLLFVMFVIRYPIQTIFFTIFVVVSYARIRSFIINRQEMSSRAGRRRAALRTASIYLAPYRNIWSNLKLSNKFCTLRLGYDGKTISARDSANQSRYFTITSSKVHSYEDLWNMFCISFSHNTTFYELVQLSERFNTTIRLRDDEKNLTTKQMVSEKSVQKQVSGNKSKELLDVNNASEIELTALPGVSIVMAKKLIKKREEIGGFKSVSDICLFLHLKPHMQKQLEQLICVKKMKGSLKITKFSERSVDI